MFLLFEIVFEVNRQKSKQQNSVELHLNIRYLDAYIHLAKQSKMKQNKKTLNSRLSCAQSCWNNDVVQNTPEEILI